MCLTRLRLELAGLAGALSLVAGPAAQSPAPPQPATPTFRAATRLVQVSVVVHDKDGRAVPDLTRGDFTLFEDGKAQPIQIFSVESDRGTAPAPAPPSPGTFSNRVDGRAAGAVTVILFDRLNTRFEDQAQARAQVVTYLGQIQRNDRVALYVLESNTVRVLHDFTSDAASLLRVLSRYRGDTSGELAASEAEVPEFMPSGLAALDADMAAFLKESTERVAAQFTMHRVDSTTAALEAIANHLAGIRGRKNLVWVSSAFPLVIVDERGQSRTVAREVSRATRAVNNANIAIYPVDARGLIGAFASPPGAGKPVFTTLSTTQPNMDAMRTIAEDTGGRAFVNSNDITSAVRRAIDDGRLTYVLGYYPAHGQWNSAFHQIRVKVSRPGLDVRHRKGYLALPAQQASGARSAALRDALRSPLEATGLGLMAHVARIDTKGATATEGQTAGDVRIAIRIDPGSVTLEKAGSLWEGAFDLLIGQSTSTATFSKDLDTTVNLQFPSDKRDQVLAEGLTVNRTIALRADVYRLLIVVRDVATGAMGSVIIPADQVHAALAK